MKSYSFITFRRLCCRTFATNYDVSQSEITINVGTHALASWSLAKASSRTNTILACNGLLFSRSKPFCGSVASGSGRRNKGKGQIRFQVASDNGLAAVELVQEDG